MTVTTSAPPSVLAGSVDELASTGQLVTKIGALPVVVFWADGEPRAIEDRCPHMGFPLHRGTVEAGMVTCHWHHARFDLESGCTLDPWADDAVAFDTEIRDGEVLVSVRPTVGHVEHLQDRLAEGLEDGLTLVVAKSVLGLLDAGAEPETIVRTGLDFGVRYRAEGWGAGLTVLVAMGRLLPHLKPDDRALALVHGLTFLAGDTRGHQPRFDRRPLPQALDADRLADWYRRFVETRSTDAAERTLATAITTGDLRAVESMMDAAVTDHVFVDGGHTLDFTNKAFEAIELLGSDVAATALSSLVNQTVWAGRSEETSEWRHPHDLAELIERSADPLAEALRAGEARPPADEERLATLADELLADDPEVVVGALLAALEQGTTLEQAARATALAASRRIARFHTQNEHGDWNIVHHTFTAANALHQSMTRTPTPELARGLLHGALRVYLNRFLNVPAARSKPATEVSLSALAACWDAQGAVDEAGAIASDWVTQGHDPAELIAALGHALIEEDAGFHWYQMFEATVTQAHAWPDGSDEQAVIVSAFARFLAAHTPTRREQTTTFRIAQRLRRGEHLYED